MRMLRLHADLDHRASPDFPALRLFADVILDAVELVHGVAKKTGTLKAGPVEVEAARTWIRNGNIGAWMGRGAREAGHLFGRARCLVAARR